MAYLSLEPVSTGLYAKLQDATLLSLAVGGIFDDVPQQPTYPFVWYEAREARDLRGFGGGTGLPEVEIRVHTFSQFAGAQEAQRINARVIELLRDQAITIAGYDHCGLAVFYDETVLLPDSEINGVKVRELVSLFRVYAEESAA